MKDRFKFNLTLFQVDDWANYLTTEKLGTAFVYWQYYTCTSWEYFKECDSTKLNT